MKARPRVTSDRARMEANRLRWDERIHQDSSSDDLAAFRAGHSSLHAIELEELGDVEGRSLLHLQCHAGLDSLSWARLGARVTGVDFSERAISLARSLGTELGLEARFIQSNVYDLTRTLHEQFDVVFTGYGVLCWLPDVDGWARVVTRFLRPGGTFLIVDEHPMAACFDEVDGRLALRRPLFQRDAFERPATTARGDPDGERPPQYQWSWTVGGMASALIESGLRIERLSELPLGMWRRFPGMTRDADGWWRIRDDPLALLVVCRAVKPL